MLNVIANKVENRTSFSKVIELSVKIFDVAMYTIIRKGNGTISAAGGSGWGGGGGGRISLECYSIQDVKITAHGL